MTTGKSPFERLSIPSRLDAQLRFLREIDRLKDVWRKTLLLDGRRVENDAEHSWEMALMAVVLAEFAPPGTNMLRVVSMLLVHDLVEIDAGDAYAYDAVANRDQPAREARAATRIFGLLPPDLGRALRMLWEEFEARVTAEARFARAMDRLQPLLHSYQTSGRMWVAKGVTRQQVEYQMKVIAEISPALGALAEDLISDAVAQGFLAP